MKRKYYSQHMQDLWVVEQTKGRRKGFFVEVGAYQQESGCMSNTLLLEEDYGWEGILIEPCKNTFKNLKKRKSKCINYAASNYSGFLKFRHGSAGFNSMVSENGEKTKCDTLSNILIENNAPQIVDLLSIDVEGHELEVLQGTDFDAYKFNYVIIESKTEEQDEAITTFLCSKNMHFVKKYRCDLYFHRTVE